MLVSDGGVGGDGQYLSLAREQNTMFRHLVLQFG